MQPQEEADHSSFHLPIKGQKIQRSRSPNEHGAAAANPPSRDGLSNPVAAENKGSKASANDDNGWRALHCTLTLDGKLYHAEKDYVCIINFASN